jgi:UDP-GlcNAc3NAcA epimerase
MKIVTIVGARPQFVKAAVVSRAIAARNASAPGSIEEIIIHTGQHYDANMSDVFFVQMEIPRPDHQLQIRQRTHGAMTGEMLAAVEDVLMRERPDAVLVYGDTNSTLAGALAAAKLHIPVCHVEAGLRSFNQAMPEEVNRVVTDHVSLWLCCPTVTAVRNLETEGLARPVAKRLIVNVGDVMFDAVRYYSRTAYASDAVHRLIDGLQRGFYLATIHRAENTDVPERLESIVRALNRVSESIPIVLPLHPRTAGVIRDRGLDLGRIQVIEPVGYFDMLKLLDGCRGVFTDSGGLQKEAFFFRRWCVTLRDETEWVELVDNGVNILAGAREDGIIAAWSEATSSQQNWRDDLYGDGRAGEKIVRVLQGEPEPLQIP